MQIRSLIFSSALAIFAFFSCSNVYCELLPRERTLIIIKPDGMALNLTDYIYKRFETELGIIRVSEVPNFHPSLDQLRDHYLEHSDRDFYPALIEFMRSGPVSVSVWVGGPGTIRAVRQLVGATNPTVAGNNTIRGKHATSSQRNVIHASDSPESAAREIRIWFGQLV